MQMYLTPLEYRSAPTAIDTNGLDLTQPTSQAAQDAALTTIIARAGGWIDKNFQPLIATTRVDLRRVGFQPDGFLSIHPDRAPLNQLIAVAVGTHAGNLVAVSDLSGAFIDQENWVIPSTVAGLGWPFSLGGGGARGQVLAKLTSVGGWPNTTIVSGGAQGSTALTVASGVGFTPALGSDVADQTITIYDADKTETITVTSVAGNVLTCSALAYTHVAGVAVSGLPGDVKEAATLVVSAFIRERSSEALTMSTSLMTPGQPGGQDKPAAAGMGRARMLLADYARVR